MKGYLHIIQFFKANQEKILKAELDDETNVNRQKSHKIIFDIFTKLCEIICLWIHKDKTNKK